MNIPTFGEKIPSCVFSTAIAMAPAFGIDLKHIWIPGLTLRHEGFPANYWPMLDPNGFRLTMIPSSQIVSQHYA